jgi:hypothetical protein
MKRRDPAADRPHGRDITVASRDAELAHGRRDYVGSHGDIAPRPQEHQSGRSGIVSAIECEVLGQGAQQHDAAADLRGGVLEAGDIGDFGKTENGLVRKIGDCAARHVVEDKRDIDGFGDGLVMGEQSVLRGLVVIGQHR